jgi:exosortase family protein XrtM
MTNKRSFSDINSPLSRQSRPRIVFIAIFLAIFGVLDYGYYLTRGTIVEHLIIDKLTVRPAAAVVNLIVPNASAKASGNSLLSSFGRINILQGCEGTEGMFLLIAAVLPFPARWRSRVLGVLCGVLLMYILNQVRIVALVATLHWHRDWFASLHGLIAPTFIVLAGCLFFFAWANAAAIQSRA